MNPRHAEQRHSCLSFRYSHAREQDGNPVDWRACDPHRRLVHQVRQAKQGAGQPPSTDRATRKKRVIAAEAAAVVTNPPESDNRRRHRRYSNLQYERDQLYDKEEERPCRCASRLPKRLNQVNRPNFHLSVVACVNASGHVIPPLSILPGQRLSCHIMSECNISGARVVSAATGFINRAVFVKWVQFFSNSVPPTVKRPLLLLFDGYLSHLSIELIQADETLGIRFVCLPANATHLIQSMDITVFSPYMKKIRSLARNYMFDSGTLSHIYSPNSKTQTYHGEMYAGSCHIDKSTAI